jgi:hypothetical protein
MEIYFKIIEVLNPPVSENITYRANAIKDGIEDTEFTYSVTMPRIYHKNYKAQLKATLLIAYNTIETNRIYEIKEGDII